MIRLLLIFLIPIHSFCQGWEAKADTVIKYATQELGTGYKWGTCKPGESFDCSGLTHYAYGKIGINCPRNSTGLAQAGTDVSLAEARKGDLMLFRGTNPSDSTVGHVGIVVENENGQLKFIHCSSSTRHPGVVVTSYYTSGYPKRYIGVKRLIE